MDHSLFPFVFEGRKTVTSSSQEASPLFDSIAVDFRESGAGSPTRYSALEQWHTSLKILFIYSLSLDKSWASICLLEHCEIHMWYQLQAELSSHLVIFFFGPTKYSKSHFPTFLWWYATGRRSGFRCSCLPYSDRQQRVCSCLLEPSDVERLRLKERSFLLCRNASFPHPQTFVFNSSHQYTYLLFWCFCCGSSGAWRPRAQVRPKFSTENYRAESGQSERSWCWWQLWLGMHELLSAFKCTHSFNNPSFLPLHFFFYICCINNWQRSLSLNFAICAILFIVKIITILPVA